MTVYLIIKYDPEVGFHEIASDQAFLDKEIADATVAEINERLANQLGPVAFWVDVKAVTLECSHKADTSAVIESMVGESLDPPDDTLGVV